MRSNVSVHVDTTATLPAGGRAGRRARGRSGGRQCKAGQYGYVPLGRHLVSQVICGVKEVTKNDAVVLARS